MWSQLLGVGAAQAATALLRACGVSLKQDQDQDQTIKASATKAAGNFLLSKATKESHQRKMLLF
ncbi:hypothetical protein [Lysobacter sp. Hz 25]|uniref:hypothetical protein n=1 Tax=Lysobacter sp. Hz 25 TaxID=3383698 RepID=UPI0038D4BA81